MIVIRVAADPGKKEEKPSHDDISQTHRIRFAFESEKLPSTTFFIFINVILFNSRSHCASAKVCLCLCKHYNKRIKVLISLLKSDYGEEMRRQEKNYLAFTNRHKKICF